MLLFRRLWSVKAAILHIRVPHVEIKVVAEEVSLSYRRFWVAWAVAEAAEVLVEASAAEASAVAAVARAGNQ